MGSRGTGGRQGDGYVIAHVLLKTLHSFHFAAAMLMSYIVNHGDVSLISVRAVTQ